MTATTTSTVELKAAIGNRWPEVLANLGGIDLTILDGRHHACPKCGGVDRFRAFNDGTGGVFCNGCFAKENGDGFATLQWLNDWDFPTTIREVSRYVGIDPSDNGKGRPVDLIERVARSKGVNPADFVRFGATVEGNAVSFPMYGPNGKQCSTFTLKPGDGKGLSAKGKRVGVFLPHDDGGVVCLPQPGGAWVLCEGVKDPAALSSLGYNAAGIPRNELAAKFVRLFRGVDVTIIPDRDTAGENGAKTTAARLHGTAATVRVAQLPIEFRDTGGADVRDVLKLKDGETLVRQAIADAVEWEPPVERVGLPTALPGSAAAGGNSIIPAEGRTDNANAKRLAERHGNAIRWCDPWGKWIVWDGRRWAIDQERLIQAKAKDIGKRLWDDLAEAGKAGVKNVSELVQFAKASNGVAGVRGMLELVKSEPNIAILPDALDGDPWGLNVLNGTIDLRTMKLREHDRADYITKLAPVEYDPDAECRLWLQFLRRVMGGNIALIDFLQRLVGYSLTGCTTEHVLPFMYGSGANGKSTFVTTVQAMLGPDYSMKAAADLLMLKRGNVHPTERADLWGKRLVACVESEDGRKLAESMTKELTGGDRIRARRMREDHWEFAPTHTVWLAANHKPIIRGTDLGIWRRVKLIPFTVTIPENEQDKRLPEKLTAELPGILRWALFGCEAWQTNGLQEPDEVKAATAEYRSEQDVIGQFLADRCEVGDGCEVKASELFKAYRAWCDENNERAVNQMRFGNALNERGIDPRRTMDGIFRQGVGLRGFG